MTASKHITGSDRECVSYGNHRPDWIVRDTTIA